MFSSNFSLLILKISLSLSQLWLYFMHLSLISSKKTFLKFSYHNPQLRETSPCRDIWQCLEILCCCPGSVWREGPRVPNRPAAHGTAPGKRTQSTARVVLSLGNAARAPCWRHGRLVAAASPWMRTAPFWH